MTVDIEKLKELAKAATQGVWIYDGSTLNDWDSGSYSMEWMPNGEDCEGGTNSNFKADGAFMAAANPAAVLELIAENEALRKDAERWRCVRNAIPMQSPYAVWREGSHVVLGKDADDLVDNFLSAKEKIHD